MSSLRARLLVAASLVLAAFFVLTAAVLDSAFRESTVQAQRDKLEGLIYALLAAARTDINGDLTVQTDEISDRRLVQSVSGLQAALFDEQGRLAWTSTEFLEMPSPPVPDVGEWIFHQSQLPPLFSLSYGLRWIDLADDPKRYTFVVIEDASSFERQLGAYRRELWLWLAATDSSDISARYPDELRPLASGLNAMIRSERSQQTRYRNALGDLAHSLKTPLAVLRGISEDPSMSEELRQPLVDQLAVMQQITGYQLRKAATAGRRTLTERIAPYPIAEKITQVMGKVYSDKEIKFDLAAAPDVRMRVDNDDLFEMLGNLIDNACKYGATWVGVTFAVSGDNNLIMIEDNGPGFPEDADELLERGARADTQRPGQGIGLSAVNEIVKAYEGNIRLSSSDWGGASVVISLPS